MSRGSREESRESENSLTVESRIALSQGRAGTGAEEDVDRRSGGKRNVLATEREEIRRALM